MPSDAELNALKRQRPEWEPWLAVIDEVLRGMDSSEWDEMASCDSRASRTSVPLLAGAGIPLRTSFVRRFFERLIRVASTAGTMKMATLERALDSNLDMAMLFRTSLCQESDGLNDVAAITRADAEALQGVLALLPVPFLQACNRRFASSISESWVEGYCPVCGAWPAFAEVRGIERSRHSRCGRCGGEWHAQALTCPYCRTSDHHELVTLVPESPASHAVIDACKRCLGYVKTFTRLQGCAPAAVLLEDLASVDLDVAAVELGYSRPTGIGYPLAVSVVSKGAARGLLAWIK